MNKITPRDYQQVGIDKGVEYIQRKGKKPRAISVYPTAAGKSIIIGGITAALDEPTLVLQPSVELLQQNYNKLIGFGGEATIFSASAGIKELSHTTYSTLGSIKTMASDFKKLGVKTVLIDEVHAGYPTKVKKGQKKSMFRKFMDELKPTSVLGLTATPFRLTQHGTMNGSWSQLDTLTKNSQSYFKEILDLVQIQEMTSRGYWSKLNYELYDFDEGTLTLNTSKSEFTEESISKAVEDQGVNNNIYLRVKKMLKDGERKKILVFCDSIATCAKMVSLFPGSAMVTGTTPKKERAQIVDEFVNGSDINLVFNYSALGTGFDNPELDCVIFGRPTNSLALLYQWGGRGTRIHPDKEDCLIIDYCGNIKRFGRFEELVFEEIDDYGLALFNGDERLITNTPMDTEIYREDIFKQVTIDSEEKEDITMWFGKFKGKKLSQVDIGYMNFMLKKFDFNNPKMKELKRQLEIRVKERALKG